MADKWELGGEVGARVADVSDAEVEAIAAAIRDRIKGRLVSDAEGRQVSADRRKLAEEFGRRHGWTWRQKDYGAQELFGKQPLWHNRDLPPHHDHGSGYRIGRKPVAIVSQPYRTDESARAEMQYWAEERGLLALFPAFPSWWYPGRTILCVFALPSSMPKPQASNATNRAFGT